ncbi:DUF547 domain-containing protein [Erythrobacter sp.]|uniref:DUF547 domain-containing protein n=1 Tax=Erythrobacter sp. TaxID=1042 RepID=UPI0025FAFEA5|nr:DUF547 domain-containing protein [Erythrobacter sp.]
MVPQSLICLAAGMMLAAPAAASAVPDRSSIQPDQPPAMQFVQPSGGGVLEPESERDRLAIFAPTADPIRHRIDYEIWDWALKNIVLSMGPSTRQGARRVDPVLGTRVKQGPQSRYRLEGSLVLFNFLDKEVIASFTEYRQDLERVADTLDIAALPRNEQLAFWLNLHNVALLEQLVREWPLREPREVTVDGVPLDDATIATLRGIPVSLRDIRENIVFRHWRDPKVIYGFWRGEIGGPELQRFAFNGANVGSLLDLAAMDFVNSLRGTQKLGDRLEVATLYAEVAPFYFPDFEADLRAHLTEYAEPEVAEIVAATRLTRAAINEHDIADFSGGARPANYLFTSSSSGVQSSRVGEAGANLLAERQRKLQRLRSRGEPRGRVFFSNIVLPGDPPNKNAVE